MNMELLPVIWAAILALSVALYVVLDGFSLGLGILFPFAPCGDSRDVMMRSVSPVWDGNQTWLVGGGAALFTAFPKAFHLLLTVLYLPLMLMLLGLVLRGAAFEFRFKANITRPWDWAFAVGSTLAAFSQGVVLGAYVLGFGERANPEALALVHIITPFSLFTGLAVLLAYALLATCWLQLKTRGELQQWARRTAKRMVPCAAAAIAIVSIWTPLQVPAIAERWFQFPNFLLLSPVPIWTTVALIVLYISVRKEPRWEALPFVAAIALFLMTLSGLGASLWPYVVPRSLTLWEAAGAPEALLFVLFGVLIVVPVILAYTANSYYVFRGKVN